MEVFRTLEIPRPIESITPRALSIMSLPSVQPTFAPPQFVEEKESF